MTLGENLQNLRKETGLSQEDVAQTLFVTRQTVSKWENNQAEPGVDNLKALADLYGVTLEQLTEGAEKAPRDWPIGFFPYVWLVLFRALVVWAALCISSGNWNQYGVPYHLVIMVMGLWLRYPAMWVILLVSEGLTALHGLYMISGGHQDPEGTLGLTAALIFSFLLSRKAIRREFHVSR